MVRRRPWLIAGAAVAVIAAAVVGNVMTFGKNAVAPSTVQAEPPGAEGFVSKGSALAVSNETHRGAPTGALRLEGQAIDDQQQPVAGAQVTLLPGEAQAVSGPDGTFAFDRLVARRYRVAARKGDIYADVTSVRLTETSEPVILRMHRGATLVVHVVEAGSPVVGAKAELDGRATVVSDANGIATIGGLGPHFHAVEVTAEGRAPAILSLNLGVDPGGTIDRTVTLEKGASLAGVVVGPDGKAVSDATVEAAMSSERWRGRASTDSTGAWHFDALGAGKYQLRATSRTYGPAPDVTLELDGVSPRRDVVVHVAVDAQLVGTVVDPTGKPVLDAVAIATVSMTDSFDERTDSAGRFEMLGIRAGTYEVSARKGGQASPATRVSLSNGERVEVRLVVADASIAGTVVDKDGTPVPEARVSARPKNGRVSMAGFSDDVTDSRGHFDLGGLEPGEYLVSATWPDQQERRLGGGEPVNTGNRSVKLVLEKPATITGRLTLDGRPLPYFGVLLTEHPEFPFMGNPTGVRNVEGRFALRGINPATWGLVFAGPGTARKTIADIKVEDGKLVDLGDIVMSHGQRITGHVRDSTNAPVPSATVTIGISIPGRQVDPLQQWFQGFFETTTDAEGAYSFDGIAPLGGGEKMRPAKITATHPTKGSSLASNLPDGDATVDLALVASGGIDGVVEGFSRRFGMVHAQSTGEQVGMRSANVDGGGKFHFEGVPPGEYTIAMTPLPGTTAPSPATVTVVANQRATATLVMPKATVTAVIKVIGATCTGVMLAQPGDAPLKHADERGFARCAGDTAELDDVEAGAYRACVDGNCVPVTVAATPARQTIEVHVPKGP